MEPAGPLWISHRGYKEDAGENTLEAFEAARSLGFVAFETDLRVTRDDQIVLIHDPTLKRLAGDPRKVHEISRAELERIRLPGGSRPLFLDECLESLGAFAWHFDIKPEAGERTIRALGALTAGDRSCAAAVRSARFLTWRPDQERMLREAIPGAAYYARERECWRAGLAVLVGVPAAGGIRRGRTYALSPRVCGVPLFRRAIVQGYRRRGARTVAFLPPTDIEARSARDAGVDEILTDGRILPGEGA